MSRRSLRTLLAAGGAAAVMALLPATAVHAAPYSGGNYGAYAREGQYPTVSGCAGTFRQVGSRTFEGMALKYYYSDACGSFARIENARVNCAAVLERSDSGAGRADGWVSETVDASLDYAYTKIGNNLNGRVSRAILACDGHALVNTGWY
ncbi:hypothetical protein ACFY7X_28485 [Streptomyces althioticus]|uniref:hypothetical protein n=1 Tax=Streptomyces althioticus TaxID=83380 RepID=UPI0033F1E60A